MAERSAGDGIARFGVEYQGGVRGVAGGLEVAGQVDPGVADFFPCAADPDVFVVHVGRRAFFGDEVDDVLLAFLGQGSGGVEADGLDAGYQAVHLGAGVGLRLEQVILQVVRGAGDEAGVVGEIGGLVGDDGGAGQVGVLPGEGHRFQVRKPPGDLS